MKQLCTAKIERDVPVRVWVLDAWIVGPSHVRGSAFLDFEKLKFGEPLPIQFNGEIVVRENAYRRPLVVAATSRIPFQTTLLVGFDRGKFYIAQGRATAHCKSTIHDISTQRGRVGSRLVTRLGWRVLPRRLHLYDAEASRLAEIYILDSLSEMLAAAQAE